MTGEGQASCPFCMRIAAGQFDERNRWAVAFPPLSPVTEGHMLVVPVAHVPSALANTQVSARTMEYAVLTARRLGIAQCNFITSVGADATQSVGHLHIHVVPRRPGDGLHLPWTGQRTRDARPPRCPGYECEPGRAWVEANRDIPLLPGDTGFPPDHFWYQEPGGVGYLAHRS